MTAPSAGVITIIKNAVGGSFTDDEVDTYWDDAATEYTGDRVIRTAVIVALLKVRLASASAQVDYKANAESESLSQEAKALQSMIALYTLELEQLEREQTGTAKIGVPKRVPSRNLDVPYD